MDYDRIHLIYKAKDREDADIFEEEALNYLCGCGNAKMARVAIAGVPTDGWEEATLLEARHVRSGVAHMREAYAQTRNIFHYGNATVTYGRTYPGGFDKVKKRRFIKAIYILERVFCRIPA